jgi:hypothetical protein
MEFGVRYLAIGDRCPEKGTTLSYHSWFLALMGRNTDSPCHQRSTGASLSREERRWTEEVELPAASDQSCYGT